MAEPLAPGPSWNPFRCGGTALPVPLLLMAKLVALSLLLTNHVRLLPDPFLPFVPALDGWAFSQAFKLALQTVFVVSALALLFNRWPRAASVVLGASMLLAVVCSKAYYGNNKTFSGLLLLFTGLWEPRLGVWLFRAQMVVVYFGAGLNKLLDPDWQSGQFFHHWAGAKLEQPLYLWASSLLPPLALAKFMCYLTMVTELGLAVAFLFPRAWPWAIWVSLLFHAGLLEFTGSTFTMFFYAMEAAMFAFVAWPKQLLVLFDGDCGICNDIRRWWNRIDFDRLFEWKAFQTGAGDAFGISRQTLEDKVHLVADGRVYSGFRATKLIMLYTPLIYFVMAILIAAPPNGGSFAAWWRRIVVAVLLAYFFPLFNPVGEAVYNWVARNRSRFSGSGECAVEARQER